MSKDEISRRELLKILAAGAATAGGLSGCETFKGEKVKPEFKGNPILGITALPQSGPWPTQDPFLFCVHHNDQYPKGTAECAPAASLAGRQIGQDFSGLQGWSMYHGDTVPGFPRHPHRGFETVTVVKQGIIDHSDSLGATARYGHGDVQWLTAGNGINHAEMFPLLETKQANPMDFFQIWLNLPAKDKRVEPHFSMFWKDSIPKVKHTDKSGKTTTVQITSGDYGSVDALKPPPNSWASNPDNHVAIWTIELEPGAQWTLPATDSKVSRNLYLVEGNPLNLAEQPFSERIKVAVHPEANLVIQNGELPNRLLLLQGKPIAEPVVQHGPFVMNTREEIIEAIHDYQRDQFGGWPWPNKDPIHKRDAGRFAHHADDTKDVPI